MKEQQTGAVAARPQTPLARFNGYILQPNTQNYLRQVLGEEKNSFVNNIVGLVSNSPLLQKCEPSTVMFAAVKATALKLPLDPNLGFAYVVPYGGQAQFQIGWRGFVQLALRTNLYRTINVRDVREGELLDEDFASGEMRFAPLPAATRGQAPVAGYLAFFELVNGFRKMSYWTVSEVRDHAQRFSRTYANGGGVWASNFDAMAKKTVLKLLIGKYGPMSVELQGALSSDQAVLDGGERYVDNAPEAEAYVEDPAPAAQGMAARVMTAARAAGGGDAEVVDIAGGAEQ